MASDLSHKYASNLSLQSTREQRTFSVSQFGHGDAFRAAHFAWAFLWIPLLIRRQPDQVI